MKSLNRNLQDVLITEVCFVMDLTGQVFMDVCGSDVRYALNNGCETTFMLWMSRNVVFFES